MNPFHAREICYRSFIFHRSVRRLLREALLLWGHVGVLVGIASAVVSREHFVPYACSSIASIDIVEVVAISAEGIAEFGLTRERDGFAARDEFELGVA